MRDEAFFAIYGTKGILYLTDPNQFGGEVKFLASTMDLEGAKPVTLGHFTPYDGNFRGVGPSEMAEAIKEKRPNRASKEMAYHVLEILTRILEGGEEGRFYPIVSTCEKPLPLQGHGVRLLPTD